MNTRHKCSIHINIPYEVVKCLSNERKNNNSDNELNAKNLYLTAVQKLKLPMS